MKNWTNLYFQEVLDKTRLNLLPYFSEIKKLGFYLAWWTWLALQLWHRQSIDFDFFVKWSFDETDLFLKLIEIFNDKSILKTFSEKNTLYIQVDGVKISFFWYDYDLIWKKIETDYFDIASIEDIWAMKLRALQKRAMLKDYVDLYYILQKIDISKLIDAFFKKYGKVISEYLLLKSLIYFDDVEKEKICFIDKEMNFEKIKNWLIQIVRDYEKW